MNSRLSSAFRPLVAITLGLGLVGAAAVSVLACGGSTEDGRGTFDDDSDDDGTSSSSGNAIGNTSSSGGGTISSGGNSSGGNQQGCSDAAKLVYVLSGDYDLYSFNPGQLEFKKIGALDCQTEQENVEIDGEPVTPNTPNSMAVDRTGTAWVGYQDGELFKVDTSNAKCTKTNYAYDQQDFDKYGMGFSTDEAGGTAESLYLIGERFELGDFGDVTTEGRGLQKLDTSTLAVTQVGDFTGQLRRRSGELTGGGDGKLYGFFTTSPAVYAAIDKSSAATSDEQELDTVDLGSGGSYAFAFSYWGGDFWFYSSTNDSPSKVTRVHTSTDGTEETVIPAVEGGFQIVGAGVSTCAPTSPQVN